MKTDEEVTQGSRPPAFRGIKAFLASHGVPWNTAVRIALGLGLVACVGLVAVAVAFQRSFAVRKAEEASRLLHRADTIDKIQQVMSTFPSLDITPRAMLKLAQTYYAEGYYDQAYAEYERFSKEYGDDHPLGLIAVMGKIVCIESQNRFEEALAAYTAFASQHPDSFLMAEAEFGRGRCLEQLGRREEARQVYEKLIEAQPDSVWIDRAEQVLEAVNLDLQREKGTL